MTNTYTLSSVKQLEEEIKIIRTAISEAEDLDEIVELDEKLDLLYRAKEINRFKELSEDLRQRGSN